MDPKGSELFSPIPLALMADESRFGTNLTDILGGDFVFLFPCDKPNQIIEYKKELHNYANIENRDGRTRNGVINDQEDLGTVATFGNDNWKHPHNVQSN